MLKVIYDKLILLFTKPEVAWVQFQSEGNSKYMVMNKFSYPLMITAAVLATIADLLFRHASVHVAIIHGLIDFVTLFSSFFIVRFFLSMLLVKKYQISVNKELLSLVTAYSFSIVFVLYIFMALSPSFFFLWIFFFYTPYLIWIAGDVIFHIDVEARGTFVLGLTGLIAGVPWIISFIFNNLFLPNLK
ncbi:MAG: hypothetical protein ACP5F6_02100 [Microbacter sp.]